MVTRQIFLWNGLSSGIGLKVSLHLPFIDWRAEKSERVSKALINRLNNFQNFGGNLTMIKDVNFTIRFSHTGYICLPSLVPVQWFKLYTLNRDVGLGEKLAQRYRATYGLGSGTLPIPIVRMIQINFKIHLSAYMYQ